MARYFFHLKCSNALVYDEEGSNHDTVDDAVGFALVQARCLMGADVSEGFLDLGQSIIVRDEHGMDVRELPCALAINFKYSEDYLDATSCPVLARTVGFVSRLGPAVGPEGS